MEANKALKTTIHDGTEHTAFSEYPKPSQCPEDIQWRMVADLELDALVEEVVRLTEKQVPQRISIPAIQIHLGVADVKDLLTAIDTVVDQVRGTPHMASFPTFRFTPELFVFWKDCANLNRYVWSKAVVCHPHP
ncbi:MAG: hypothetical protein GY696_32250 [Gammaproteobacteria bacterium]|nr:hypothetical protein [Gammaproteobacteria bacterium]